MGCSQGANTCARTQRDGGEGSHVGRTVVVWAGAVVVWCERPSGECNPPGGVRAGLAGLASVRTVVVWAGAVGGGAWW